MDDAKSQGLPPYRGDVINQPPPAYTSNPAQPRRFLVSRQGYHDMGITTEDEQQLLFVQIPGMTFNKPNIILHAGRDKHAPVVAACKFPNFSGDSKIGLGDPNKPNSVVWELLEKKSWNNSEYQWHFNIPGHGRKAFTWKRTRHVGIGGDVPSICSSYNFKLVNLTNEILAVYNSAGPMSFRKVGKFQINVDYGKDFDILVFLTGLALLLKARRRTAAASAGGGGA